MMAQGPAAPKPQAALAPGLEPRDLVSAGRQIWKNSASACWPAPGHGGRAGVFATEMVLRSRKIKAFDVTVSSTGRGVTGLLQSLGPTIVVAPAPGSQAHRRAWRSTSDAATGSTGQPRPARATQLAPIFMYERMLAWRRPRHPSETVRLWETMNRRRRCALSKIKVRPRSGR
jgi:hypothetical protein